MEFKHAAEQRLVKWPAWMGATPRAGEPWTDAEDAELATKFRERFTAYQLANFHGRSVGAINSRLDKLACNKLDGHHLEEAVMQLKWRVTVLEEQLASGRPKPVWAFPSEKELNDARTKFCYESGVNTVLWKTSEGKLVYSKGKGYNPVFSTANEYIDYEMKKVRDRSNK